MTNKQRGYQLEAETRSFWQEAGFECRRIFASGAYKMLGEDFKGDLILEGLRVECKRKKSGWKQLYSALDQDSADLLVVREDRARRLYIMEESTVLKLLQEKKGGTE
jgi:Holliday junction resolvase